MIDLHDITMAFNRAIAENSGEALVPFSSMFSGGNIADATALDAIRLKEMVFANHVTVGASGALFGILLAFGWLFPEARMGILFVPFMIPARIFVAIYAAFELFFGVAGFAFDNVAHFAHLGGMLFGAIVLWVWQRRGKLY
jgi:membrane associated rhomboid family serine protease